jgi:hypothetical protein
MSVTFYFDYFGVGGIVNPDSPVRTFNVSWPGSGASVSVNTTWTYATPNANFSGGQYWVNITVQNNASESSSTIFPVYVTVNSPPFMDGLLSLNAVSQSISPHNPVVPLVYENVTVGDPDSDPVTVTWFWGDGNFTVNRTGLLVDPIPLNVSYLYAVSSFPLNQTPRYVDIPVVVWIDDGLGHNVSENSTTEFYIDFDSPPSVRVDRPTVGSVWKVGDPISMSGTVTDPEGDPITAYWDFDNRTDSTSIGDPTRNQDALGTTAVHTYTSPGTYNITLWGTDGDKQLCRSATCANFTTHWVSAVQPISVQPNAPPFLAINNATAVAGQPILLRASVFDADGDSLTVRWVFGDGTPDATNVTARVPRGTPQPDVAQEHNYTAAGNVTMTVYVSDGNATINSSVSVMVQSFNLPPVLLDALVYRANGSLAGDNTFPVNATVIVHVRAYDPENNTLDIFIDWADGTTENRTIDPRTATDCAPDNRSRNICTIEFTHAYGEIRPDPERNYTVVLTVTDHEVYFRQNATGGPPITLDHEKEQSLHITITTRLPGLENPWDWWDSSTLALVIGIPSLLVARFAWKVRRERREA